MAGSAAHARGADRPIAANDANPATHRRNMVLMEDSISGARKARPYASAIINLQPVQVGEKIPGSDAVLIGVESRAIGIEIEGTGERFHIRF